MENNQQKIDDILEVVTFIKDHAAMQTEVTGIKTEVTGIKIEVAEMNKRLTKVEATMVTKDYLDEKLGDLKGDIIVELRHEDKKVVALIEVLRNRNIISIDEAKNILGMKPFPQIFLS